MSVTVAQVRTQIADQPQMYPPSNAAPEIIGYGDGVANQFTLTYANTIPGTLTIYAAPTPAAGVAPTFTAVSPVAPIAVATTSSEASTVGVSTITPGAMTNIAVGVYLRLDPGLATQEDVLVTAVTGTTFTAVTTQPHAAGFSIVGSPAYSVGAPSLGTNGTAATNQVLTFLAPPANGTIIAARAQVTAFADSDLAFYLAGAVALGYPDDITTLKRVQFDILSIIIGDQRRMTILSQGAYKTDPGKYVDNLTALKKALWSELEGGPVAGINIPAAGVIVNRSRRYEPFR